MLLALIPGLLVLAISGWTAFGISMASRPGAAVNCARYIHNGNPYLTPSQIAYICRR